MQLVAKVKYSVLRTRESLLPRCLQRCISGLHDINPYAPGRHPGDRRWNHL